MKKHLSAAVLMVIICILTTYAFATQTFHNEIDVNFNENTQFSLDEQQIITAYFNGLESGCNSNEINNIICTLFGHNYTTEIVNVTEHNVYSVAPKCVKTKYKVSICTRCSDTVSKVLSIERIYCH